MKNLQDISGTFIVILVILSSLSGPLRALLSSRFVRLTVQITISRQTLRKDFGERKTGMIIMPHGIRRSR